MIHMSRNFLILKIKYNLKGAGTGVLLKMDLQKQRCLIFCKDNHFGKKSRTN